MTTAAQTLAQFAAGLRFEDIPADVVARGRDCMIDTIAAATFGAQFPWSRMVAEYAQRYGTGGKCSIMGFPGVKVHAPYAALANGALSHGYEQDSVRDPGAGAHPGATVLPALLAACEEAGTSGRTAVTAYVAAVEVMFRIALASHHSPEHVGFHSPGLTGPYGSAVAAGLAYGLNATQLTHALGIAGSLSSGLLAFTKSQEGAMVKRLHLGRASESGILAARLAGAGYTGPETMLEGKFGFLDAFGIKEQCEAPLLTKGLGSDWEVRRICLKRYAAHINAHTPVQALRELMAEHKFTAADVTHLLVEGSERLLTHHNIPEPADLMKAQYSIPFCVAVALHRDPDDPRSFNETALADPAIRATAKALELRKRAEPGSVRASVVTATLKDGRKLVRKLDVYKGMPADPLSRDELKRKFMLLTGGAGDAASATRFERLEKMADAAAFSVA
jgi:2-methylcitrate dehydratase PrpD